MVTTRYQASKALGQNLLLSSRCGLKKCSKIEHSPEDWISQLPDEILVLILSFLTLKEAAQTSVLSSRWMTLWTHTLRLDFDATSTLGRILYNPKTLRSERCKYVAWVNHVLLLHKGSTLDEFRFCFDLGKAFQNSIDEWLEYAFAKRVKRLELDLSLYAGNVGHPSGSCSFPSRLLNPVYWTSLGQINSYLPRINHNLLTDFISLKELSLKCVNVTDEVIKFILLKCLFLERLVVLGSGLLVNLVVSCPSLMLLEIKYCTSLESISICNSNLVTLKISRVGKLIITNTPMLAEVHIEGCFPDFPLYVFSQLSCCLSQLEFLMFDMDRPEKIARLRGFPELSELKELVINVGAWGDDSLIGFTPFLQSCPNLQKFVLQLWWINPTKTDRECEKAMKCSLKYLKEIELSGYYGRTSELELITFFLDNAIALEKIIIDPRVQSCLHRPLIDCDQEQAGRLCATQQLEGLVPSHIELVIT